MGRGSDAELLDRFRRGEESALELICERYEQPLFRFLLGLLRDHHRAEDALQETFVEALGRVENVDPEHLRGWLFTVAYHQAMLSKRKQAIRLRHFPGAAPEAVNGLVGRNGDPVDHVIAKEEKDRCRKLLHQLPEVQREVIRLHLYEGKRFREIAADLGCPLSTALARMHQGLKRLRALGESENGRSESSGE
jgi:RNA polymerase sigma-70 factor (ECF subfamily)